jgi:sarcosine oxidase
VDRPGVDVAVVGAGIAGLAAARAIARAGRSVVVFEQFRVGHRRGSSHGTSRIYRLSYADEQYARMMQETLPLWRELEQEAGEELLVRNGALDAGSHVSGNKAVLDACGIAYEELSAEDVDRRFGISLPYGALYQADGGILRADRCAAAFLAGALRRRAELREDLRVTALHPKDGGGVRLETSAGAVEARVAVVTAGPWSPGLLERSDIALDAVPTRETVVYLRLAGPPPPSLIDKVAGGREAYALVAPGVGIKAGLHQTGPVVDPDLEGAPQPALAAEALEWARSRFPTAEPAGQETCLYTNRPDNRFFIERRGPIVVGSACSGHGFKFAPWTGERLAALAEQALHENGR